MHQNYQNKPQQRKSNFQNSFKPASPVTDKLDAKKNVTNSCSAICGTKYGLSCSKTLLVDIATSSNPSITMRAYAIIDEQSSHTFATSAVFDKLQLKYQLEDYTIRTLSSQSRCTGRTASGLIVKGVNEEDSYSLPLVYENNNIPDTKDEAATPDIVRKHPGLQHLAHNFAPLDKEADVCLLIGRDAGDILATTTTSTSAPFAHKTSLGWAVVGAICPLSISNKPRAGRDYMPVRLRLCDYTIGPSATATIATIFLIFSTTMRLRDYFLLLSSAIKID